MRFSDIVHVNGDQYIKDVTFLVYERFKNQPNIRGVRRGLVSREVPTISMTVNDY